jgi:hypothetical protein
VGDGKSEEKLDGDARERGGGGAFQEELYRGTSLLKNRAPLGPTVGLCLGPYGSPIGGGLFLMSEVPL